jgi:hypothetical protein
MSATLWGLIILAKLCQMNGQMTQARIFAALAAVTLAVELWAWASAWLRQRRERAGRHD